MDLLRSPGPASFGADGLIWGSAPGSVSAEAALLAEARSARRKGCRGEGVWVAGLAVWPVAPTDGGRQALWATADVAAIAVADRNRNCGNAHWRYRRL